MKHIYGTLFSSKIFLFSLSILLTYLIGCIDYHTGYELGLSILYLVPLYITTWRMNRGVGVAMAVLAAFTWTRADLLAGKSYSSLFVPCWNFAIRTALFSVFVFLVNKIKLSLEKMTKLSKTDFKSGIGNAQFFYDIAEREIQRSKRYNRTLTLVYIDCDNFKSVNDSFGHRKGDEVLRMVATVIHKTIRLTDICARIGGDEFVVLYPESDYDSSQKAIKRLQSQLLSETQSHEYGITFSMGGVTFSSLPQSVDEMLQIADKCMYDAKNEGKNKFIHTVM